MIATALLGFATVFRLDLAKAAVPGDLNAVPDGHVGIDDAIIMSNAFGSINGSLSYIPAADLNGDGVINILDMILLGALFGHP
jgi:hypothetical protein